MEDNQGPTATRTLPGRCQRGCYVYEIRLPEQLYIGITNNPRRRWAQHMREADDGHWSDSALYRAMASVPCSAWLFQLTAWAPGHMPARLLESQRIHELKGKTGLLNEMLSSRHHDLLGIQALKTIGVVRLPLIERCGL